jgi:hypothetical protein
LKWHAASKENRRMPLRRLVTVLATVAALALAPAALAGKRFSIGPGKSPHVVVEPADGTAHVVWLQGDTTMECNVPRGATSCTPQVVNMGLPADKPEADTPWLLRASDGTLYIFMARYVRNDAWLARSTDGGQTWSTGIPVYKATTAGIAGTDKTEPVLFPSGEVSIASFNGGGNIFAARLDGAEAAGGPVAQLQAFGTTTFKYDIQVVPVSGGGAIAVAHDTAGFFWTMSPGADPSLTSSWGAPAQFTPLADETRAASGTSGTYVLSVEPGGSFRHVMIRKLGAAGFGTPVEAESEQGYITDLTEGPSGTVAGAWRTNGSDPDNRLRFSTSKDGSAFTTVTIARGGEVFADLDVSIASDDRGFAVWQDDNDTIDMASTDPIADANAPPGTGTTQVEYPNATITLGGVTGCVNPGGSTSVRLGFARKKRKGNVWIKPFRVDFSVGSKLVKKVTKAPFKATIKVKASAAKGSFVEVRARAFIKVHRGKVPKKSIRVRIPVCA